MSWLAVPEVVFAMATYKQAYLNSCGAAALLCAAFELNIKTIPENDNYRIMRKGSIPLELDRDCEEALYQVTSNNSRRLNPVNWGFSMPTSVIQCASLLGLDAFAMAYKTFTTLKMKINFREELIKLRCLHVLVEPTGVTWRHRCLNTGPIMHQRELKILINHRNRDLHYVMVRPDGTVMEPSHGRDFPGIIDTKRALGMHGAGFSLIIQNQKA